MLSHRKKMAIWKRKTKNGDILSHKKTKTIRKTTNHFINLNNFRL